MIESGFTWGQVEEARAGLEEFREAVSNFVNANGVGPAPTSPARQGELSFSHRESVETVYSQAMLLIEVAADQLTAFLKTTEPPFEAMAPWTCVRALLEAAALGSWLMEPGISVSARVRRSVALRYEGLEQQRKYLVSAGEDTDPTAARIQSVLKHADGLGFPPVKNGKGRHIGAGEPMPATTELVRRQLGEESMYRLLSAVAHGHSWAIRQLGFQIVPSGLGTSEAGGGARLMTKSVSPLGYMYLSVGCAKSFGRVNWSHCLYAGWDESVMHGLLERLFDRIGAKAHLRFWN